MVTVWRFTVTSVMNISLANALRAIQNAAEYRAGTEGVVGAVGIVEGDGVEVNVLGEA